MVRLDRTIQKPHQRLDKMPFINALQCVLDPPVKPEDDGRMGDRKLGQTLFIFPKKTSFALSSFRGKIACRKVHTFYRRGFLCARNVDARHAKRVDGI
jgi:hypothetical protein